VFKSPVESSRPANRSCRDLPQFPHREICHGRFLLNLCQLINLFSLLCNLVQAETLLTSLREEPAVDLGRTPTIQVVAVEVCFSISTLVPG